MQESLRPRLEAFMRSWGAAPPRLLRLRPRSVRGSAGKKRRFRELGIPGCGDLMQRLRLLEFWGRKTPFGASSRPRHRAGGVAPPRASLSEAPAVLGHKTQQSRLRAALVARLRCDPGGTPPKPARFHISNLGHCRHSQPRRCHRRVRAEFSFRTLPSGADSEPEPPPSLCWLRRCPSGWPRCPPGPCGEFGFPFRLSGELGGSSFSAPSWCFLP